MKWFRRKGYEPPQLHVLSEQPWMEKTIVINDKPTTLRTVRKFAMDMAEKDYRNPAEAGMAMTIVALVDEISWLHTQLRDATSTKEEA